MKGKVVFAGFLVVITGFLVTSPLPVKGNGDTPAHSAAQSQEASEDVLILQDVIVEAVRQWNQYGQDGEYRVGSSSFALGGTQETLKETPFSVSVFEEDFFRDLDPEQVDDAAEFVPGVQTGNQVNNTSQVFQSRGFQLGRDSILINGTQQSDAFAITPKELVAGIEFYRGPSGILNGQSPPGGAANIVTKKPLGNSFARLTGRYDQHGQRKLAFDGNLAEFQLFDRPVSFRLNLSTEESDTFRDAVERQTGLIAPVLTAELTDQTDVTLEANIVDWEAPDDRGLPLLGGNTDEAAERFDESAFLLGTTDEENDRNQRRFMVDLSHEFNDTYTSNFQWSYGETERSFFAVFPRTLLGSRTLVRDHFGTKDAFESLDTRLDLQATLENNGFRHRGIAGVQWREFERRDLFTSFVAAADTVDIFNPDTGKPFQAASGPGRGLESDQTSVEGFIQDQITVRNGTFEGIQAILGTRFISFDDNLTSEQDEDEFTSRVGLVYTPPTHSWATFYGNWSESFNPQGGTDPQGNTLPPQEGEQFEFGFKSELLDGNLLVTGAYFDLENRNVGVQAPADPFSEIAVGEQENQGFEFELVGKLTNDFKLRAQYTLNDGEITKDPQRKGNQLQLTPDRSASLWFRYHAPPLLNRVIPTRFNKNLTVMGGITYVDERFATIDNQILLTSYERADFNLRYRFKEQTELQVNLTNLTDERYFTGGNTFGGSVLPAQPFTVGVRLTHSF